MNLKPLYKLSLLSVAMLSLAACSSNKKVEEVPAAPVAPAAPAQTAPEPVAAPVATAPLDNEFGFNVDPNLSLDQLKAITTYYFKFDSTQLLAVNLAAVQAQGKDLSTKPTQKVLLKGYTDIQGSREYNIGLGYRRAKAVASELMAQGTHKNQIEMVSYGPEFPAAEGNDEHAYQKNRRVELSFCEGKSCKSVYGGGALKGAVK